MPEQKPKLPEKFEDAFGRLEEIVSKLETGDTALEESIDLYTEGMTLVKFCNEKLATAREKIEQLTAKDAPEDTHGHSA